MKIIRKYLLVLIFLSSAVYSKNVRAPEEMSVQEYYSELVQSFQQSRWMDVISLGDIVNNNYPDSSFSQEALYYMGVAYFNMLDYDVANTFFTKYLKQQFSPKFFEEAIHYKFVIAEKFKEGFRKRLWGWKKGPKIVNGGDDAIEIYEEVITTLPTHDLAVKSMFSKAQIQADFEEYKESIETLQTLIRKFPKHELAIESFLEIEKIYFRQTSPKHQNPDLLDMAKLNLKKFKEAFPAEERFSEAEKIYADMEDVYAEGLYEIGRFFERTKKKNAAIIYYNRITSKFPNSKSAQLAEKRLQLIKKD